MFKLADIRKITFFSIITFAFILIQTTSVYAVSESAVLFLLISPSPQANGMGETYGNIASIDPMASIINPAYLGYYSQKHNFGFSYSKTDWLPELVSDMAYSCYSLNFGYSLKNVPISFGIGYHRIFLDLGEQVWTGESGPEPLGTFNSWDKAHMFSASFLLDYYIRTSFGFSYKFIESNLLPFGAGQEKGTGKVSANAHDFGISFQAPLFEIISKLTDNSLYILSDIKPYFNPGFSYSINNIGNKITYIDAAQADPLPRSVYTGINIDTGLKLSRNNNDYNIISFKWAREANDLLFERYIDNEGMYQTRYLSGFNDIDFIDNIILGKGNSNIITNKGWEFGIGDIFFIRKGYYEDIESRVIFNTNGLGINFVQPIRLFLELTKQKIENELLKRIIYNVDIEYHHSEYDCEQGHPPSDTNFNSVSLKIKTIL